MNGKMFMRVEDVAEEMGVSVSYDVMPHIYNINDLENGIIRKIML